MNAKEALGIIIRLPIFFAYVFLIIIYLAKGDDPCYWDDYNEY